MPGAAREVGLFGSFVAEILADTHRLQGRSLRALEDEIGVSHTQISRFLRGERAITLDEFHRLSIALDLDPIEVLQEAEARLGDTPATQPATVAALALEVEDDDALPDFTLLAARTVTHRPGWDAASAHYTTGEESQD